MADAVIRQDRRLWRDLAKAGGLGVLVAAVLLVLNRRGSVGLSAALCVCIPITLALLAELVHATVGDIPPAPEPEPAPTPAVPYFSELRQRERRLESGNRNPEKYARSTRIELADLAAERLRNRHGVTVRRHPDRARTIVGEQVFELLMNPGLTRPPSRTELTELVTAIEAI